MPNATCVLVVEDDPDLSEQLCDVLEDAGYEPIALAGGGDALAFLMRTPEPCTVLLDLQIEDMDGWEVLSVLRSLSSAAHRVVVMSGLDRSAFPRGVPALHKPFTMDALLAAVAQEAAVA